MIWAFLLAWCLAVYWRTKERGALIIAAFLIGTQIGKPGLHHNAQWFWSASCDVLAGYALTIYGGTKYFRSALLMVVAGSMVAVAKFSGMPYGFGNPFLSASDIALVFAAGYTGYSDFIGRVRRVGSAFGSRVLAGRVYSREVAAQRVSARHGRS